VISIPTYFEHLRASCIDVFCDTAPTPPPGAEALRELGITRGAYAAFYTVLNVIAVAVHVLMGAVILLRRSQERVALLGAFTLLLWGTVSVSSTINSFVVVHQAGQAMFAFTQFLSLALFALFFYLFPDGRFEPKWIRWLGFALIMLFLPGFLWAGSAIDYRQWPPLFSAPLLLTLLGSIIFVQIHRYRHTSDARQRRQTKWVVHGIVLALTGFFTLVSLPLLLLPTFHEENSALLNIVVNTGSTGFMLLIPFSLGVAILRHRLWDIDLIINRTFVYVTLTLAIAGLYVLIVSGLGMLLPAGGSLFVSLFATAVIAVLFAPLRQQLQHQVNLLLYGERAEPYTIMSRLGQRLEATVSPTTVLPTIVTTVREALNLPYVAIAVRNEMPGSTSVPSSEVMAASGENLGFSEAQVEVFPISYGSEILGDLTLTRRAPNELFSRADQRLLHDLVRQAGAALYSVKLLNDLQRSRERLVVAREEERRRLRNDLHDGLGPQLSGLTLKLETARHDLKHDPVAYARLTELVQVTRATVGEIRRIVHELRPPVLDELGLAAALREIAASCSHDGSLNTTVEISEDLPKLSAALEVAVFRIVQEALTNVIRHTRARECKVKLDVKLISGDLLLEVIDDGEGISPITGAGVGLHSMRERAAELGGSFNITSLPEGGTRVQARFPLEAHDYH
jgi:signal transduction histidine kinase